MSYIIRQAVPDDVKDLFSLARQTYFINLPPDKDIIAQKIEQSVASFRRLGSGGHAAKGAKHAGGAGHVAGASHTGSSRSGHRATTSLSDLFLFVVENTESPGCVGTSQIIAGMGGPGHPRVFFQLSKVVRRSESLKRGVEHTVGVIGTDETGPTEVGGIIVNQAFRGSGLGKLLSLVRFHLIGLAPARFAPTVIAEMLGPIDDEGRNPFFEKFTSRFVPYSWDEIYRFSQTSREFVASLMPPEPVYLTAMEPEVAGSAGEVSEGTVPARRMLESIGFRYHQRIDPLDGGPHLEAPTKSILPVKATRRVRAIEPASKLGKGTRQAIISALGSGGEFRAVITHAELDDACVRIPKLTALGLKIDDASVFGYTDLGPQAAPKARKR